ncbi:MAG TPA: dual specificity protein phosphatase [Marmoricola sp.]|nr:dual specificity protein phosphatase family protein [Nocardioidaceae bacterium]MCO5323509.1 dual specificity protein phosphatase family protein [Nocardioidaceae bacterium]HRV67938.1 dual specificity protein phosphatase [Marmoricola sp.]
MPTDYAPPRSTSAPASTRFVNANADFVTDRLLVGGDLAKDRQMAAEQLYELAQVGVTHIFDARIEWSDEGFVRSLAPTITYFHQGMDDVGQRVPFDYFDEAVCFVNEALGSGGMVLAHCHMGINRGPSVAFAALLAQGCDSIFALDEIRRAREIAWIAYAEDALRWHHRGDQELLAHELSRLAAWREANQLDLARVLRLKRRHSST